MRTVRSVLSSLSILTLVTGAALQRFPEHAPKSDHVVHQPDSFISPATSDTISSSQADFNNPLVVPRVQYNLVEPDLDLPADPPENMTLYPLYVSGNYSSRVNLMFFSDGYTQREIDKFVEDAQALTHDIISPTGAMGHVSHLLNIWAVFVPSSSSGIGTHSKPIAGAAFGLYRPGPELRGVYVDQPKKARAACRYWRESLEAGCDQPILLGNDPLYGGLGGEFTIITASKLNGPIVLRHELGHSLIPVGEEYEGGFAYFGVNSDKVENKDDIKWKSFLSDPDHPRIEDVKAPLQVYPWQNLTGNPYAIEFNSNNPSASNHKIGTQATFQARPYPHALVRISLSSIPYPSQVEITLNDQLLNLTSSFLPDWDGSKDRRWVEVVLKHGLPGGQNRIRVELSDEGNREEEGQGGKMLTSLEVIEYGTSDKFNGTLGFIGAFPTYAMDGSVTLRPTNEECLMRKVNHPTFCSVCADELERSLKRKIKAHH